MNQNKTQMKLGTVTVPGEGDFSVMAGQYPNGRLAVYLNQNAQMHLRVSQNVADFEVEPNTIFAKMIDVAEPYRAPLLSSGLFEDTGKRLEGPYFELALWRVKHEAIADFVKPATQTK